MAIMTIEQLTAKIRNDLKRERTKDESLNILVQSKILNTNGEFNKKFFSSETVNKGKNKR